MTLRGALDSTVGTRLLHRPGTPLETLEPGESSTVVGHKLPNSPTPPRSYSRHSFNVCFVSSIDAFVTCSTTHSLFPDLYHRPNIIPCKNYAAQHTHQDFTMSRQSLSKATGLAARSLRSTAVPSASRVAPRLSAAVFLNPALSISSRFLSTTPSMYKGILPDTDDPSPPNVLPTTVKPTPAEMSDEQYHALSEEYMDTIYSRLEEIGEKNDQVDVEYSVSNPIRAVSSLPAYAALIFPLSPGWRPKRHLP